MFSVVIKVLAGRCKPLATNCFKRDWRALEGFFNGDQILLRVVRKSSDIRLDFAAAGPGSEQGRRWCIFTSAGDRNAIRLWLKGNTQHKWDLVIAYYGDDGEEFSELAKSSSYAFRTKGGKFQNLKKLVAQKPEFFDQYSHVWVCDDDIHMSAAQIDEAFAIAEFYQFWIAQPAFSPRGKISHLINEYAGSHCDYRLVNFVEENTPIFLRERLIQFLNVYDGSLFGDGMDWWYLNFFKANELGHLRNFYKANELGRFAIIDRIQVINPLDEEKGRREIDQLEPLAGRRAKWAEVMAKYGLVVFPQMTFASCTTYSHRIPGRPITSFDLARRIASSPTRKLAQEIQKAICQLAKKRRPAATAA